MSGEMKPTEYAQEDEAEVDAIGLLAAGVMSLKHDLDDLRARVEAATGPSDAIADLHKRIAALEAGLPAQIQRVVRRSGKSWL